MSSLIYLSTHRLKNKFIELMKKPGKLILTLVFVALLIMNLSVERFSGSGSRPVSEFYAIVFAFYILCFLAESFKGFSHGGTIFSLSDVSFLFMSPVKPAAVLFHGMLGRLGTSLWMGLAFVYQFSLLRNFYPVGAKEMLVAVIGYGAVIFLSQLAGMLIYFFTCGDEKRVALGRKVLYAVIAVFAVIFAADCDFSSFSFTSAAEAFTKPAMLLFPVCGWVLAFVKGILESSAVTAVSGIIVCVAFAVITFVVLSVSGHGYYEDVLTSAEKNAELSSGEAVARKRKVPENIKGGIGKGKGASAFYFKHKLENRRAGTSIFSPSSLFYLLVVVVYGLMFKGDAATLFILSCTISIHTVFSGRWIKELMMPYIYMIPGSPSKKLFFILPELLPRILSDSILHCAVIAFVCKTGIILAAVFVFARISFGFLLTASALLASRLMREKEKSNVFVMLSMFLGMLFSLPSMIAAFAFVGMGMGTILAFIAFAAVNIIISFAVLFMSRNLLKAGA